MKITKCIPPFLIHTSAIITGENINHIFLLNSVINFDLIGKLLVIAPALLLMTLITLLIAKETIMDTYKKSIKSSKLISRFFVFMVPALFAIIAWIVIPSLIPAFEITSPKNSDEVDQLISVSGHGAIPGSEIEVLVIDDIGQKWPQGITYSNTEGYWELHAVHIGRQNGIDIGKEYIIYASLKTPKGTIYSTKSIQVARSDD